MSNMIFKTFAAEIKATNNQNGEVDIFLPMSTASIDREGESILPTAFKKHLASFKKRPVLVSSHDYKDLTNQIGDFTSIKITEEGLYGKPRYYINQGNREADWGFFLASQNMAAYSVGFIPIEWEDNPDGDGIKTPRRTHIEAELLEISHVIVPSNREAAQSVKDLIETKGIEPPDEVKDAIENLITKPETTENYHRVPAPGEEGKHDGHRIRTITISEEKGIKALYCGECKKNITYLFDVEKWTMAEAREWVKEHSKEARSVSQSEIKDELDYVVKLIESAGMNEEVKEDFWGLVREGMRLPGNDIPVDILTKVGAVLNQKNRDRLEQIKSLAQEVIDSAEREPEQQKEIKPEPKQSMESVIDKLCKTVSERIDKALGKVD